jgi:hypothetical protein
MRRFAIVCVVCATASLSFAQAPPYDQQTDEPEEGPAGPPQDLEIAPEPDQYSDTDPSALSDFRTPLAPYGNWIDDPTYGTVWIPHRTVVGDAFVPYQTAGHWAMDGANYVWMSDYAWGWLPFHYGRWVFIDGTGWAWIPGRAYAPSWVDWSVGDDYDYVGWYPTPPDFIWWGGVAVGLAVIPAVDFFYCPTPFLFDANVHRHVVVGDQARQIHLHARTLPAVATMRRGAFERGYVRGPAVSRLGSIRVVQAHPDQRQLALAQRYSTPATAKAAGAAPPSAHRVKVPVTRARQTPPYTTTPRETAPPTTPTEPPRATAPQEPTPHTPPPPDMRPRNPPREPPRMTAPRSTPTPETRAPTIEPRSTPVEVPHAPEHTTAPTPPPMPPDKTPLPEHTSSPLPSAPPPVHSEPPMHSAPPPTPSEPPVHSAPPPPPSAPPVHSAPPMPAPPPSPPMHRAPASEAPPPSAPDPTPPSSPSTPAPSSSEPGSFDSAAGIART